MGMFGAKAFAPGGTGRAVAGYIGDALLNLGGQKPVYAPQMQEQAQQRAMLERQMMLARYKAQNPDPTGTMQNAQAAGHLPGTPGYQKLIEQSMMAPHYITLGNPESGQTVIDANNPPPAGGDIDPAAVARLKANPAEAQMFDEHFGPGSAARVLGSN